MHADFRLNKDLAAVQCRFFERLLMLLAFLFLAVWATNAYADFGMLFEWRSETGEKNSLRLSTEPCKSEKVLQHIRDEWRPKMQSSTLTWQGKRYDSCWLAQGGNVYSIDESGDLLPPIPYGRFRKDEGV